MNSWRKEIQDFSRSCEVLLSQCMTSGSEPFNEDERQLIAYYVDELKRMADERQLWPL